ncbi:hypothetical protein ACLMJK_009112 [Lecanora helva]
MASDNVDWDTMINLDRCESPAASSDLQGIREDGFRDLQTQFNDQPLSQSLRIDAGLCSTDVPFDQAIEDFENADHCLRGGNHLGLTPLNDQFFDDSLGTYLGESELVQQPSLAASSPMNPAPDIQIDEPGKLSSESPPICTCIVCTGIRTLEFDWRRLIRCCFPGCEVEKYSFKIEAHERSHFLENGQYRCQVKRCNFSTSSKRWSDLQRHSRSKHCINPAKKLHCPVSWCKFSEEKGFARKDKLNSHLKKVHSEVVPGKANRAIMPKSDGAA